MKVSIVRAPCLLLAVAFVGLPTAARAQTVANLAAACSTNGGDSTMCSVAAVAGRALLGHIGVLSGPGSEVSGVSSTLGRRLGGRPLMAPSLRVGGLRATTPDIGDPTGAGDASFFVPSLHAGLGLGIFDGFPLLPTVGGFLSLDVFGQASFLFFSEENDFDGRVDVFSFGARLGILRESFTLPGVSVSVARRLGGRVRLGDTAAGDPAQVTLDPSVTSVRATVGKDLFAIGVMAGWGWDDYSSEASVRVTDGVGGFALVSERLDATRHLYFVGAAKQVGVLSWISVEVGWARGFEPVASYSGSFDPTGASVFASLALLFKL